MFNKLKILKKMKIKNLKLMLVSAFLMMGSAAFAATQYAVYNGVRYSYVTGGEENGTTEKPYSATVYGLSKASTTVTIPATFTTTDENEITLNFKVTGFKASWTTAVTTGEAYQKSVDGKGITEMTLDATNMSVLDYYAVDITKLETLKLSSTNAAHVNNTTLTNCTGANVIASLTSLDLSGCTKMVTINASAFQDWALTSVKLPESIATIGALAFAGTAITTIDLSKTKVTELANGVFYKTKLATISLPEGLTTIKNGAFQESALTTITIPAKVTSIESDAFYKCEALTTADLSAAVDITIINSKTFFGAKALTAITIPAKVTSIGESAFEGCEALATITMSGEKLTTIDKAAFKGTAITAFEVPATVTSIGESAFEGCKSLATFTFATRADDGAALATIGTYAFKDCEALTAIDLSSKKYTFDAIPAHWFDGCKALKEIKLSENIKGISEGAFQDCVIEELDLSGVNAEFYYLFKIFGARDAKKPNPLKSIILPESLKKIFENVFDYSALTEITLPASLTADIPAQAFYYCTKLKTVNYEPTSVATAKAFNEEAFLGCTPFVKINTNSFYFAANTPVVEPTNATFGVADDLAVTPVQDKANKNNYYAKICPKMNIQISKAALGDAKLYSVYVDEGIAYFQALKVKEGNYVIAAGQHAILKAKSDATVEFEINTATAPKTYGSIQEDKIFSVNEDVKTADFQGGTVTIKYVSAADLSLSNVPFVNGKDYVYALTNSKNSGGFGFTYYKGATLKAGAFFIVSRLAPSKEGRIETVWLDEDGNVESEATAINKIQSNTEDGAIYNLQGVRVNNAKKGIYIKNGKKYIMK
jgi:hypothetical protein